MKNNSLDKEMLMLKAMVKMGLLNTKELKARVKELGKKYNMEVIFRIHDITTDKTKIEWA